MAKARAVLPDYLMTPLMYANDRRSVEHPGGRYRVIGIAGGRWCAQRRVHDTWESLCSPFTDRGEAIGKMYAAAAIGA